VREEKVAFMDAWMACGLRVGSIQIDYDYAYEHAHEHECGRDLRAV
jgi:hypothetical protein